METYEKIVTDLKKEAKKEFFDMTDEDFVTLMKEQPREDLEEVRKYLISSRDFYKRILLEEYQKTHPNSFRYKDAEDKITRLNNKGKLLKTILEKK
jgi:hypothetical protein